MEKLLSSIRILDLLSYDVILKSQIIVLNNLHKSTSKNNASEIDIVHYTSLFHMSIIQTQSFIEEYNESFGQRVEKVYQKRIENLKKALTPLSRRLLKWKDLEKFRNEMSAHNMRSKREKNNFVLLNPDIDYNTPRNFFEVCLISNILNFMIYAIKAEFENEYKHLNTVLPKPNIQPRKLFSKDDLHTTTIELINGVNKNLSDLRKEYKLQLTPSELWINL